MERQVQLHYGTVHIPCNLMWHMLLCFEAYTSAIDGQIQLSVITFYDLHHSTELFRIDQYNAEGLYVVVDTV